MLTFCAGGGGKHNIDSPCFDKQQQSFIQIQERPSRQASSVNEHLEYRAWFWLGGLDLLGTECHFLRIP